MVKQKRLIIVSNRLPVVFSRDDQAEWSVQPGSGGLVTAMTPVLRRREGVWLGWTGTTDEEGAPVEALLEESSRLCGFRLVSVPLTEDEKERFYFGFSNEVLWPLFHDLQSRTNFDPTYWKIYQQVNEKYARVVAAHIEEDDFVWVQDYHLMTMGGALRAAGVSTELGYFLHIPFPPLDIFVKLPWRGIILRALLEYDVIGFQTHRDRRNFLQCVEWLVKEAELAERDVAQVVTVRFGEREVRVGVFPISIDFAEFADGAADPAVDEEIRRIREQTQSRIILGVDRLDYTKGLPHRLKAFRNALERFPELRREVILLQVVVPSREHIPEYHSLKNEVDQLVGEINGLFTDAGWVPIHYVFRSLEKAHLLALYRAADVALITPLKDGMNLVAKEFAAANVEEDGVLILSEFAGAAPQFAGQALLVNPYDVEGVAEAIHQALTMDAAERTTRMRGLREIVQQQDIFWWVSGFLRAVAREEEGGAV